VNAPRTVRNLRRTDASTARDRAKDRHQITGQRGLSPANCRKVMAACIQSVAMFGSELWWKGGQTRGTVGQENELQLLVNQEARAATDCLRATDVGALSMESGLRPATAQLEDRQRSSGPGRPMCSRAGRDWTTEPPDTRRYRRTGNLGRASKPTWATIKRPTTWSAPPSLGRWNRFRGDR